MVEDPLRPHSGFNVLNTDRSTAESIAYALAVFNVWVTELWPIWTERGAIEKRLDLTLAAIQKDVVRQWHGLNEEQNLLFETVCLPAVKKTVDAEGDMWRLRAIVLQSTPTPKASTEHQSERSMLLQIDGDSWFSDVPHSSERGAGSVFAVAYARDHPAPLLRPVNAARLSAIGTLLEEAREAVQRVSPQTRKDAERCLGPAISKYAKEVFDRRAEVKLRDAGPRMRSGAYGRWLRSKCLPVVVYDVCMFDGLFQITVRHVADYIGDGYPDETFRALWGILARELEPDSFRPGMEARLGAELEARSLYWEGQVPRSTRSATGKAKAAVARSTEAGHTSVKGSSTPSQTKTAAGESRAPKVVRQAAVAAFLVQCNQHTTGKAKIKKKHIWLAAGHKHARQFQYWQSGSDQATNEDDRNFGRLLSMAPADFVALLIKKRIAPANS